MVTIVPPSLRTPATPAPTPGEAPPPAPPAQAPPTPAIPARSTPTSDLATTLAASEQAAGETAPAATDNGTGQAATQPGASQPGTGQTAQGQASQDQVAQVRTGPDQGGQGRAGQGQSGQGQSGQGQSAPGQPEPGQAGPGQSGPGQAAAPQSGALPSGQPQPGATAAPPGTATAAGTAAGPGSAPAAAGQPTAVLSVPTAAASLTTSPLGGATASAPLTTPPLAAAPAAAVPVIPPPRATIPAPTPISAVPMPPAGAPAAPQPPPLPGNLLAGLPVGGAAPTPAAVAQQIAAAPAITATVAATAAPILRPTAPASAPSRSAAGAAGRPTTATVIAATAAAVAAGGFTSGPFAATPRLAPGALYDIPRFVSALGEEPIEGLVLGQSPEGVTVLSLPQGTLAFQSPAILRPGQELLISVRDAATNPTVVLESAPDTAASVGEPPLVAGHGLDATVVRGAPPNTLGPLADSQRGDQITLHVVSQQMPGGPAVTAAVAPTEAGSEPAEPTAGASATATGTAPTIIARVIATNPVGQAIALLGGAAVAIDGPSLPVGLELQVAVTAARRVQHAGPMSPILGVLPALTRLIEQIPNLTPAAQTAILAALPKPGPRLAAELINLVAAARYGTLSALIGDGAKRELDRTGRRRLGSEVTRELTNLGRGRERIAGDWRTYTLPIVNGYVVEPIRLYVHRDDADETDPGAAASGGTRFLLDLALSKLGPIQIDGLAKPPRFDVVIRSPDRLPDTVVSEMRDIFLQATSARGVAGSLMYQVAPPLKLPTNKTEKGGILV